MKQAISYQVLFSLDSHMEGRMTCNFTSFSSVFQSYQTLLGDNERLCATVPRLRLELFPPQAGLKPRTARSAGLANRL